MNNILFLCIGDSNIVGDSLGPLIGSFIQRHKSAIKTNMNISVIGTMDLPVGYITINDIIDTFHENTFIIIIDSALGSSKNIGKIIIDESRLCAGQGVNKGKYLNGDITIRGIVGRNYNNVKLNSIELENVSLVRIENMANKIISDIIPFLIKA